MTIIIWRCCVPASGRPLAKQKGGRLAHDPAEVKEHQQRLCLRITSLAAVVWDESCSVHLLRHCQAACQDVWTPCLWLAGVGQRKVWPAALLRVLAWCVVCSSVCRRLP